MQQDTIQQHTEGSLGNEVLSQDEVRCLHVGLLLFGTNDFFAIKDTLLPHRQVQEIVQFYCSSYAYSKASMHVAKLQQSGFQPGALVSGNTRKQVFTSLQAVIGRSLKFDKAVTAALKAYDACSLALVDLVEVLAGAADAGAFAKATYEELNTVGVDTDQLNITELSLHWETLQEKLSARPALFTTAIWPALTDAGWHDAVSGTAAADQSPAAGTCDAQAPSAAVQEEQLPGSCADTTAGRNLQQHYVPPATLSAAYLASVGAPLQPCSSWQAVLEALRESGQALPAGCIAGLRAAELEEAVQACLAPPAADAPHRCVHDASAKRPGTPLTSRKFLMCANCSISYSTVWRTGNAGLTLCNACGMFYNKHDHEHRPEHLIASARAKAEAQAAQAAVAAAAAAAGGSSGSPLRPRGSGLRGCTPDGGPTDGEMSDDGRRAGSGSDEEEGDGRRPRRRRRAQVSKWLARDEYVVLDGPLRSMANPATDLAWSMQGGSGSGNATTAYAYGSYDDADGFSDGQRARNTASPCFAASGTSYRFRSSQQQQRQVGSANHGRSRSMEAVGYYPASGHVEQQRWQQQRQFQDFRDRAGSMEWEDEEGGCGREQVEEDAWQDGDDAEGQQGGYAGGWCDGDAALLEERALEDMESLLGRILLHSPSDASDSSAADALVAMSHSCISQQEQHRLQAAISCDIRAASASPGPTSAMRRVSGITPAAAAAAAAAPGSSGCGADGTASPSKAVMVEQRAAAAPGEGVAGRCLAVEDDEECAGEEHIDDQVMEYEAAEDAAEQDGQDNEDRQEQQQHAGVEALDGIAQAWARVQAAAVTAAGAGSSIGSGEPSTPQAARREFGFAGPGPDGSAAAAFFASFSQQQLQHYHSAPAQLGEGVEDEMEAAGDAFFGGSSSYPGGPFPQTQQDDFFVEEGGSGRSSSGAGCASTDSGDSGSRSASPTKAGRGGSHRRPKPNIDEDYTDKPDKGRGRSISRFGAEHMQRAEQDHYSPTAYPHSPAAAAASPAGSVAPPKRGSPARAARRTHTGELVRCANCDCDSTCLWRRDKEDPSRTLCNACGIYKTNNGIDRPTNGLFPFWKNGKERVVRRSTVRPIAKQPYKHQLFSSAEYKALRQQDLLKATGSGNSSILGSSAIDTRAGQQQQQAQPGAAVRIHPGALNMPAAAGLDLPLPFVGGLIPAEAAADAVSAVQQYLPPADCSLIADATAAVLAAAAPQQLLLQPSASLPAHADSGSLIGNVTEGCSSSPAAGAGLGGSSVTALVAALAAAQAHGSISDQLNIPDDTPEQNAAVVAAVAGAVTTPPRNTAVSQPEVLGWVDEISRDTVLGQTLHTALAHAVRMQEPVVLPSGHEVFPDGKVVLCVVNNELALMLPAGSEDLKATRPQAAAAISTGLAGSSSVAAAGGAAGWVGADAHARVVCRAGGVHNELVKDGSEPVAVAVFAAANTAAAFSAIAAEKLAVEPIAEQQY